MGPVGVCLRGTLSCLRANWPVYLLTVLALLPLRTLAAGTNRNLKDIFLGRCWEYQYYINPTPFENGGKNCTRLWELFHSSFSYRDSCSVEPIHYSNFSREADHSIPENTQLFWSGVYPFVGRYADYGRLRFYPIENTLSGYVMDGLQWCGSDTLGEGINYSECPDWEDCETSATRSFWNAISETFSQQARGNIHLMLNGSKETAFYEGSTFARMELPNLKRERVKAMHVVVVHHLNDVVLETCSIGSILKLQTMVEERGITFHCKDNPPEIRFLMCASNPDLAECASAYTTDGCSGAPSGVYQRHQYLLISIICACLLLQMTGLFQETWSIL